VQMSTLSSVAAYQRAEMSGGRHLAALVVRHPDKTRITVPTCPPAHESSAMHGTWHGRQREVSREVDGACCNLASLGCLSRSGFGLQSLERASLHSQRTMLCRPSNAERTNECVGPSRAPPKTSKPKRD